MLCFYYSPTGAAISAVASQSALLFVGEVALRSLSLFLNVKNGETYEIHFYKKIFIRNLKGLFILKKQIP